MWWQLMFWKLSSPLQDKRDILRQSYTAQRKLHKLLYTWGKLLQIISCRFFLLVTSNVTLISKAPSSKSYTCFFCRHEHNYPNQLQCISDCAIYRKSQSKHCKSNDVFIMQQYNTVGYVYVKSSTEVYRNSVHCCNHSLLRIDQKKWIWSTPAETEVFTYRGFQNFLAPWLLLSESTGCKVFLQRHARNRL